MIGLDAARRAEERGINVPPPTSGLVSGLDGYGSSLGSSFDGLAADEVEEERESTSHHSTLGYSDLADKGVGPGDEEDDEEATNDEEDFNSWLADDFI